METPAGSARADRNRLLLWVGIAFIFPGVLVFALHLQGDRSNPIFSVRSELPLKAWFAFFVLLATWIVSRMEKRPLGDYGIPLRQALGIRFWEGSVWGFALLSAILLVLRVSGRFQVDSVSVAGSAVFRYA